HDEGGPLRLAALRAEGLGRLLGVALAPVLAEAHSGSFAFRRALRRRDRLAQSLHQVDDLGLRLLLPLRQRRSLRLVLEELQQLVPVAVVVALGVPRSREL